ncbi:hypothetical protein WMY93_027740 [Mugilogobius chulae]|uniref:Sema domain-containing protein n=1 Tax=Mugilogobius chulae TaxID=88201 RepID=A0AAW0MY49_9GOBI
MGAGGRLILLLCWIQVWSFTQAWKASQPRLQLTYSELQQNGRILTLPLEAGDVHSLLPEENGKKLYVAMKDTLLSTNLDDISHDPRKLFWPASPDRVQDCLMAGKDPETECAFNPRCAYIHTELFQQSEQQILSYSQTECGKGKCPYDPLQKTASAIVDGELYAGITSDFMSRDSAFFRSLGNRRVIRTEQYDSNWLQDAQFIRVSALSETDNPEDDKVYMFFTERAQESEGSEGKVIYSRVARVCKNDIGGQRSLVNKWSTFQKSRLVCSVPGPDGLQTHFNQLQDIFILHGKDKKNPLIYGLFTTSSDILNGSAVCVYRMEDVVRVFKGNFLHKEGPQYKWAEYTGHIPYPRPGTCPSSTYGSYSSTREYPDDVIFFSRTHPLLQENITPVGERPLLFRVGVHYKFSKLVVDRVEAVDGTYDVLFIGTDSGLVLKSIHLPKEHGQGQEVTLEQMQVFQHKSPVTAMTLSKKKQWLYVGSSEGVSQLSLYHCEMYGQACAECCLARDPYCTWDGHACSPYMPTVRRRNARHLGRRRTRLPSVSDRERACRQASVTWYKQAGENSPELNQVSSGDQVLVFDRGVLIRRAELSHGGVYHCQVEEHGYHWTAVTVRLAVWSPSANRIRASLSSSAYQSTGPWYDDVMALVHPGNIGQHCKALGFRPPKGHRRHNTGFLRERNQFRGVRGQPGGRAGVSHSSEHPGALERIMVPEHDTEETDKLAGGGMSLSPVIGTEVPETANGVLTSAENGPHSTVKSPTPAVNKYTCTEEKQTQEDIRQTDNGNLVSNIEQTVCNNEILDGSGSGVDLQTADITQRTADLTLNSRRLNEASNAAEPGGAGPRGGTVMCTDGAEEEEGEKEKQDEEEDEKKWRNRHTKGRTQGRIRSSHQFSSSAPGPSSASCPSPPPLLASEEHPCPPHVMAEVWVRNVRGMQDSKSLDEISQACGGSGARGGGRAGQSEGRRATISSALELEGTVSHEGDLTNFITKNLEQKIKMSSKPSLDCSDSDCSGPIYHSSRSAGRRPVDIPPIDPSVLIDLHRHTQEVAQSVEGMMKSLNGTIQNMTALSVGYIQTYRDSVDSLGESVDMSIKGMYT